MDHRDPEWLIEQMGLRRFLFLSQRAKGNLELVYSSHQRDIKLREAFRTELEIVEFAVRIRYHTVIQALRPATQSWLLDSRLPVRRILRERFDKVYRQLVAEEVTPGEASDGLSFGFWTQLTSRNLEHSMWTPYIRHVYPSRTRRESVHRRVEAARLLRNRAAHIDVLLDQPLRRHWANILWLLDRLNPSVAAQRRQASDLPGLLG